jgi:hypothetical protein
MGRIARVKEQNAFGKDLSISWGTPEDPERAYVPDDLPVKFSWMNADVRTIQPVERSTEIRHVTAIYMRSAGIEVYQSTVNNCEQRLFIIS